MTEDEPGGLDHEDREVLATAGIWIVAAIVGASTVALAAGIAVRVFAWVSGL